MDMLHRGIFARNRAQAGDAGSNVRKKGALSSTFMQAPDRMFRAAQKKWGLSGLAAAVICLMLAFLWTGYVITAIGEYEEAFQLADHELRHTAAAYSEYAAALAEAHGTVLHKPNAISRAGTIRASSLKTIKEFRTAMDVPDSTQLTVSFLPRVSKPPNIDDDDAVDMTSVQTNEFLAIKAVRWSSRVAVTASMSKTDALADWRHDIGWEGIRLAFATLMAALLSYLLLTQLRHRETVQAHLVAAKEQAEAGNRAKSDFLANMSHEIRTPMNGILGMTSLLQSTELNEEQRRFVEVVQESGEALLTVVNDILDISKLEAGKLEIETIDFDLVATVENAAALMAPKAREKQIDLAVFVEPAARGAYRGDPGRVRQILLNLLNNAIKFTEKGGVSIEVIVRRGHTVTADGSIVPLRFEVADTGIGMPESVRRRLFQKFTQGDSSVTRRFGGTGLGLAICKELVELMHGEIGAISSAGAGSTFWFEIPFEKSTANIIDREVLPEHFKTLRALIVDDIQMNLEIVGRQLGAFGMKVQGVDDGFAAMAELERAWHRGQPYDIVFLDQMMPGLSGSSLAQRIRAMPHLTETKLVIISSVGRTAIGDISGLRLDGVLEKPLRHQELLDVLINSYSTHHKQIESLNSAVPAPQPAETVAARPLRILLAEDNKINQQFAVLLLKKAGHSVEIAENGHQAVDAVRRSDFDVVLMDIQMPELDGIEATRQIRALASPKCDIPIIAMTANAMTGAKEQYMAGGMNDYISKPVQVGLLLSKLANISGQKRVKAIPAPFVQAPVRNNDDIADVPVLDLQKLADLQAELSSNEINNLISLYLTDATLHLEAIARNLAQKNFADVSQQAHSLVSTAGNFGAMRASAAARALEIACRTGDTKSCDRLASELNIACEISSAALRNWLNACFAADKASLSA